MGKQLIQYISAIGSSIPYPAEFDPRTITGLLVWFKADALTANDNDLIATWTDSSGNGFDATGSGTQRPTYKTSIVNGKPILRFNGSTTVLQTGTVTAAQIPATVIVVGSQTSKATSMSFTDSPNGANNTRDYTGFNTSGHVELWGNAALLNDSTDHSGAFHVLTAIFEGVGSNGSAYVDGSLVASGTVGTAWNAIGNKSVLIGVNADLNAWATGDIAELLIYNSILSTSDRQAVEGYLKTKYGTP